MQDDITELISVIRRSSVRDDRYYAAEQALIRRGPQAIHALTELANGTDAVAAHRAREIIAKISTK